MYVAHRHDDGEDHRPEGPDGVEDEQLPDGGAHPERHEVQVDLGVARHEGEEGVQLVLVHQGHEREDGAECRHDEHHLDRAQVLQWASEEARRPGGEDETDRDLGFRSEGVREARTVMCVVEGWCWGAMFERAQRGDERDAERELGVVACGLLLLRAKASEDG